MSYNPNPSYGFKPPAPAPAPKKKRHWVLITLVALFVLGGLGNLTGSKDTTKDEAEQAKKKPARTSVTSSTAPTTSTTAVAAKPDLTEALRDGNVGAPWLDSIVAATRTEPERIVVETTIVDPRGDAGSDAGKAAVEVCEAAVALLQSEGATEPHVSVMEADGSTFAVYGHPSYPGACAEV